MHSASITEPFPLSIDHETTKEFKEATVTFLKGITSSLNKRLCVYKAQNLKVCAVDDDLNKKLKKFRFRKATTNAAIIMKIDTETMTVVEDPSVEEDEVEDISPDDLGELLPAHQPRYIAYSYCFKHDDGRTSYPLCFIFVSPQGCKPELQMMYAGSKNALVSDGGFTKVFEIRSTDELTEEWLKQKLLFFR